MEIEEQPMRIYCRNSTLSVAVDEDRVIMVRTDSSDPYQYWIKRYDVGMLTDEEGRRAFALVNAYTKQAMVNIADETHVELAPYKRGVAVELSRLWSLGKKGSDGFSSVRMLKDINYTLNALNGNPVEGTVVGTYPSEDGDNSMWRIDPISVDRGGICSGQLPYFFWSE